jgi:1-deoxy-D-xylulose-5-phosphate reductoisomerase
MACDIGGTLPAVMNAANEMAVQAFLDEKIGFSDIPAVIHETMDHHTTRSSPDLDVILQSDSQARDNATAAIKKRFK